MMTNVDEDQKTILQVKRFLSQHLSLAIEEINLEDSFFHDLGVDGDDAWELINEYSSHFHVSINSFNIDQYFGPEGTPSPIATLVELITKHHFKSTPRLTVKDLIEGVKNGELK